MSLTLLGLVVLVAGLIAALAQALIEESRLRKKLRKYDTLINKEEFEQQLDSNIHLKEGELTELGRQEKSLNMQIINLQQKVRALDAKAYLQSIDSYEPKYDFISSEDYILRLSDIISQQERMRGENKAYICDTQWSLGESKREGKKMISDLLKLVEFAFEYQCKYAMKEVKSSNVDSFKKNINKTFDTYNKLLTKISCKISAEYLQLKLRELDLQYELEEKKQQQSDQDQEIKKQNKEHKALDKARQKAEEAQERENIHQQELEQLQQQIEKIEQSEGEKRKQLQFKIQQLEQQLVQDRSDKEKAISESTRVKWGYIYIISNIGSLGRDVYRICMTNRQKEDEYIREMNPAVPFRFDVHFKIFSEDAFDTLEKLHQRFDEKRVNVANSRREFFKVSMDEIEQAVQELVKKTGVLTIQEFERAPQAYEYRQTLAARKKHQHLTSDDSYLEEDGIA
jgi:DNA repair exonuclease SbcCD ATPase subunit